ncbi:UDP-N-acetylmuramate--L-alanine ligase [Patescibacteria group bacterium]|nr:UDP-N-acetylmuramate--L-alanine ligase [Patescibacteria group bacterium]
MIGIKGVGMTMLAQYFASKGMKVTGSDTAEKFMTDQVLEKCKIPVIEKFNKLNIPKDADVIIYSSAYNEINNEEVRSVINTNRKVLCYAKALGDVFNQYYGIGVIGSHGKTTTSAWLGFVMDSAGLKPNVMVGARVPQFNGSSLINESNYLVAELDEYQNKFQYASPQAVILNNIDFDHPDFFPTHESYTQVFIDLVKRIPKKGLLVANLDDEKVEKIVQLNFEFKAITYAIKNGKANYIASEIEQALGRQYFRVSFDNEDLGIFNIKLTGDHNILNALGVIAMCVELEIDLIDIRTYLADFIGTERRMQTLGEYNKALIIDDYAHHPTEIRVTLAGIKKLYPSKNIICVFHPHTFTRTKALLDEFANSFNDADKIVVLDIYGSAREEQGGISSKSIVDKIIELNNNNDRGNQEVLYIPSFMECEEYLRKIAKNNDLILLMGAGDIFKIGKNLIRI